MGGGGVCAIGTAFCCAYSESTFSEVQCVAACPAYTVEGKPLDVGCVDAALEDAVFKEAANFVVDDCCDDGGSLSEASAQSSCYVVFSPAFRYAEVACCAGSAFARIEAEHYFAEG